MIYRLIMACKWTRPIYFAVTVSDDNRLGLDDYLQMEGMVFKLHPNKVSQINYERMKQNILQSPDTDIILRTPEEFSEYFKTGNGITFFSLPFHYENNRKCSDIHE